jgi:hypothetical protein
MSHDHPRLPDTCCIDEHPYTLLGCALGHHCKVVQLFPLVYSVPAKVSPEVSIQITKGPLLHHVVLRRVHYSTHSFPTRWILRASTQSAPPVGTPRLDSTTDYARSYRYRLMVTLFSWMVAP